MVCKILKIALFSALLSFPAFGCEADPSEEVSENTHTDGDTESDSETPQIRCSDDLYYIETLTDGNWEKTANCLEVASGLCRDGACVPNWEFADVEYGDCPDNPHALPHTLKEKAEHYDRLMPKLHIHPDHGLVSHVRLPEDYYESWAAENGLDAGELSEENYLLAEEDASWENVIGWSTGENDGLFSSLYVVSQAFRYGATKDPEALANIKLSLGGTYRQLLITGTPGIYTREIKTPGIEGMSCPENPCSYFPDIGRDDADKNDNRWVRIEDGCIQHYGGDWNGGDCIGDWVTEETCGLEEYNGYCWLDNVSKDEYTGHMLAAAVVGKLVDDPDVQAIVKDIFT